MIQHFKMKTLINLLFPLILTLLLSECVTADNLQKHYTGDKDLEKTGDNEETFIEELSLNQVVPIKNVLKDLSKKEEDDDGQEIISELDPEPEVRLNKRNSYSSPPPSRNYNVHSNLPPSGYGQRGYISGTGYGTLGSGYASKTAKLLEKRSINDIDSESTRDEEKTLVEESAQIHNEELSPKNVVKLQKLLKVLNENEEKEKDEDVQEITSQLNLEPHSLNKRHMYGPPPPRRPPSPRYGCSPKSYSPPAKSYGSKKCHETDDSNCDDYSCKTNKCHTDKKKKTSYKSSQCSEESDESGCTKDCNKKSHDHRKGNNNRNNNNNNNRKNNGRKNNKDDDDDDYGMYW